MPSKELTIESLSGTQKAAIMLMQLGADQSSKVLRILTEQEIADVMAEVARLRRVKTEVVNDVLTEFVAMTEASTAITVLRPPSPAGRPERGRAWRARRRRCSGSRRPA